MADHYIIVDLGASNGRVIAANVESGKFDFDIIHRFENIPVFCNEDEFCWDILRIYSDIKEGIKKALGKYPRAKSVGIDTMGCDFGFIDSQGRLLGNPVYFRDKQQHELADEMHEILSEKELFELSQGPCSRIMGIYKLYQLKKYKRFEYEHGAHLLMMPDLLNYFLTGRISNEFTNATMTLLVDQEKRIWSDEICEKLGFRKSIFTELSEPGTVLGPVKESVCRELGIRPIDVVIPATHDTASAVAGIPIVGSDKKWGFVSLGTWALAGMERPEPVINPEVVNFEFGNEGGVSGKSMLLKNINGLWVIQQCRKRWNHEEGREIGWTEICAAALESEDKDCVFNCDEPEFGAFQNDMPQIIRAFCEKTGQYVPLTMGEVARCVFKSLACRIYYSFRKVLDTLGEEMEQLHILGGGTQNELLCQWICDAMGMKVVAGPAETTAVGNLIFQIIADRRITTLEEGRKMCADSSELKVYEPQDMEYWERTRDYYIATCTSVEKLPECNNHVHSKYSFSPYSPAEIAWKAREAGLTTCGIVDHESVAGIREFVKACRNVDIAPTCGFEVRLSWNNTPLKDRKFNNPDQLSIGYFPIHGVPLSSLDKAEAFLRPIRIAREERNRDMVQRINELFVPYGIELEFDRDVVPVSNWKSGGSITERHILYATGIAIIKKCGKGKPLIRFLQDVMKIALPETVSKQLLDAENEYYDYDLTNLLKGHFSEKMYVEATIAETPPIEEAIPKLKEMGCIPTYAYLGDVAGESVTGDKKVQKFEDEILDDLFFYLDKYGIEAISYAPARNSKEQIARVQSLCKKYNMIEISGEDINQPRQPFINNKMAAEDKVRFNRVTWAIIGHERIMEEDSNSGLFSDSTKKKLPDIGERIRVFEQIGKRK